jgi:hypothetical protein
VYSVKAEPENKCITVRTANKKYFKKLVVPDLDRAGLLPEQDKIQFTHKHDTLIITVSMFYKVEVVCNQMFKVAQLFQFSF